MNDKENVSPLEEIKYVNIVKYPMILSGTWPPSLIKPKILQKPYKVYSTLSKIIFALYLTCEFIEIPLIWKVDFSYVADILKMVILYLVTGIKIFLYSAKIFDDLFAEIASQQRKIFNSADAAVKKIYSDSVKHSVLVNSYYIGYSSVALFFFNLASFVKCILLYDADALGENERRPLPLSVWLPFDVNKHYHFAFWLSMFYGQIGALYYAVIQTLIVGIVIYISGQLKILQHFFKNLKDYSERVQMEFGVSSEEAAFVVTRLCVIEHNKIIRYVDELDNKIKYIILLEFLVNSLQLATLLFSLNSEQDIPTICFTVVFIILMVNQVFILYLHANEIIVQSLAICDAIWESNWLEQPEKVRKLLPLILLRAQKAMKLSMGPFYKVSAETAVMTIKASYTYCIMIQESNKRK